MKLALFDLDHTLLPMDSDHGWGAFTIALGWVDEVEFKRKNDAFYEDYKNQKLDVNAYIAFATQAIREQGIENALKAREQFMQKVIMPCIQPQARALVQRFKLQGYECVLATATNDFITAPIAQVFGFKHLIATDLEYDEQGEPTGSLRGVSSFQGGKAMRVTQWLKAQGLEWGDLQASTFYSDSINDLPLLEKVQKPVATNPDDKLEAVAQERGWEILRLFE